MNLTFIKLDIGILNDTKIKLIRKMPEGHQLFTMWVGLLCLAMRASSPGELLIAPGLPFNDETLSLELDLPLSVVRLGLQTFINLKMVTLQPNEVIAITNFAAHQSIEKLVAQREQTRIRVQKFREKQRLLSTGGQEVTGYSVTGNATDKKREDKIRGESNVFDLNSIEFKLSSLLFDRIKERDQKHKEPNLQKWSAHIDKLHRIDKREFDEIESVINWCQDNSFWQNNILSTYKLREKFEPLYLQMIAENNKDNNYSDPNRDYTYDEMMKITNCLQTGFYCYNPEKRIWRKGEKK